MPKKSNTPQQKPQLVYDPKRKMYFDQTAGMYIEPNTNLYVDPDTGLLLEPQTNKLIPNSEAPSKVEIRPKLSELPEDINKKFINYVFEGSTANPMRGADLMGDSMMPTAEMGAAIKNFAPKIKNLGVRTVKPEIGSNIRKSTPSSEAQSSNPNRSSSRFEGTNSIVKTYKKDTPGEQKESIDSKFTDFLSEDFIASGQQPYQDLSDVFNQRQLNSLIRNEDFRAFVTHHNPDLSKVMVKELGENRYLVGDASTGAPHTMEFVIDNEGKFDYHVVRKKVTGGDEQVVKSYNYNESKTPKARETSPSQVTLNIPKSATLNINMINEEFEKMDKDPCWKGYKMVGTKKKRGKKVPNCVPEERQIEEESLGKIHRTTGGRKKFMVKVKNPKTGKVVTVRFGDPNMSIKRDNPERRKSFRARHHCDTDPGPRTKARYWSCRQWRAGAKVES
jgi:hypothetical protein